MIPNLIKLLALFTAVIPSEPMPASIAPPPIAVAAVAPTGPVAIIPTPTAAAPKTTPPNPKAACPTLRTVCVLV